MTPLQSAPPEKPRRAKKVTHSIFSLDVSLLCPLLPVIVQRVGLPSWLLAALNNPFLRTKAENSTAERTGSSTNHVCCLHLAGDWRQGQSLTRPFTLQVTSSIQGKQGVDTRSSYSPSCRSCACWTTEVGREEDRGRFDGLAACPPF